MSLSSSFDFLSFQGKVRDALRTVERTLELERRPRLAGDVEHTYGAKYGLVDSTSNAAVVAYMNCLKRLGLDGAALRSIDRSKPATLRFDSSISSAYSRGVGVDVPVGGSYEVREETTGSDASKNTSKTTVMKAVKHVTEFHWDVGVKWSVSIYSGTSVDDKKVIKSRASKFTLMTPSKAEVLPKKLPPIELSLTWLLQQIDTEKLSSQFKVDREDEGTKTPLRNDAVKKALDFSRQLAEWCTLVEGSFMGDHLGYILQKHNPVLPKPGDFSLGQLLGVGDGYSIFNPILPLMEESGPSKVGGGGDRVENKSAIGLQRPNAESDEHGTLLSNNDISMLMNEHARTLDGAVGGIKRSWPPDGREGILSSAEASLSLVVKHLVDLTTQYIDTMFYVESMMENQLVAAVGKRLTPRDLDKFVKFHNARLLRPAPRPFSHAIRRPGHYPVGLLSIEGQDGADECIHSHSREVNAGSSLRIPLSAATVLELTGQQYLHGYMNHRFGNSQKRHQLIARARQFSAFVLVIGTMTDGSTLDPKDAIIVQNKDELLIPLLLEELPTAKEFKDAVKSLSPEQQRFARAYRKMQLASSIFGVCVIQVKPQLEALLGLPADALDKEMKLTRDLMELFIEYQVPSDLLSYSGFSEDVATEDKVSNVRSNVKGVMDVIDAEKEKQLKLEESMAEMAMAKAVQSKAEMVIDTDAQRAALPEHYEEEECMTRSSMGSSRSSRSSAVKMRKLRAPMAAAKARPMALKALSAPVHTVGYSGEPLEKAKQSEVFEEPSTSNRFGEQQKQHSTQLEETRNEASIEKEAQPKAPPGQGVDFTLVPQILDTAVETSGGGNSLRSTTIKTGDAWVRNRQENLLSSPERQSLNAEEIKKERNKAFDLLDALGRSGSLPIAHSELHVVVAVTHCFDRDVMSTVVCDNVNPIEKLEGSTLLLASAVHGVSARELIGDADEIRRLEGALPLLIQPSQADNAEGNVGEEQG